VRRMSSMACFGLRGQINKVKRPFGAHLLSIGEDSNFRPVPRVITAWSMAMLARRNIGIRRRNLASWYQSGKGLAINWPRRQSEASGC